ncbi:hypothetical protein LOTGIDRAFT_231912 [Lottia gigantea]|uniref:C2 domain-containing protein n=1 Tax=Lottia gigantea TaxID=225164 RepID=V4AFM4_LOTGI|nr:hypothetical protein LOTGIDRAFT_231912 [Lottia gigantea]ESO95687.1 hypothetical protein LOTGIDRAFT_231912 [Lottia gigantea]
MAKEVQDFKKRRGLKSELKNLPTVSSLCDVYSNVKDRNSVLQFCLNAVENSCSYVGGHVVNLFGRPAELETSALDYFKRLKENYPIIRKSPKNIYRKTKSRICDWSLKKTQTILQTPPGKVAVWGVGAASNVSDKILSSVYYVTNHSPKPKQKSKERLAIHSSRSPDKKIKPTEPNGKSSIIGYTVVLPVEIMTRFLQTLHLWIHILLADAAEKTRKQNGLSPEKAAEIRNRRKVSPRKRVQRSTIKSWSKRLVSFLHLDKILPFFSTRSFLKNIDPSLKDLSPNKSDEGEHKRKYDDIVSDDDSSSSPDEPSYLDHLRKLDLSQYMSDDDPDYEPGVESTDSDEYLEGETESDDDHPISTTPREPLPPRNKSTPISVKTTTPSKPKTDTKSILKQGQQNDGKTKPKNIQIKTEDNKDYVQLTFKASKLDSRDIIGKSDPYLTLNKQGPDGKWQQLHKTETILNCSDPQWKPFNIPLLSLWNGDKSKQIKITVHDKDDAVSDDFVGETTVTLEEILKASKHEITWSLINAKKQNKKKNYVNSGQIHLVSCKLRVSNPQTNFSQLKTLLHSHWLTLNLVNFLFKQNLDENLNLRQEVHETLESHETKELKPVKEPLLQAFKVSKENCLNRIMLEKAVDPKTELLKADIRSLDKAKAVESLVKDIQECPKIEKLNIEKVDIVGNAPKPNTSTVATVPKKSVSKTPHEVSEPLICPVYIPYKGQTQRQQERAKKPTNLVPLSLGLSVSATIVIALLVTHI